MKGAVAKAEEIAALRSLEDISFPQQLRKPGESRHPREKDHRTRNLGTVRAGQIDILVSGVGTGGTITGVSRYIKGDRKRKLLSVAVEPREPGHYAETRGAGTETRPHKIQGIGAGFIPDTLDLSLVDRVEQVDSAEAVSFARRLIREEGILGGISSGAAAAVAVRLAKLPEFAGKTIVTVLPDAGERYLSTVLFQDWA